jgi:hypothetical protein
MVFTYSTRYSCLTLMKLEYSRQNFEKYPNIKFYENLSSGSRVFPYRRADGRRDRHNKVNSRVSQFCERGYKRSWLLPLLINKHYSINKKISVAVSKICVANFYQYHIPRPESSEEDDTSLDGPVFTMNLQYIK